MARTAEAWIFYLRMNPQRYTRSTGQTVAYDLYGDPQGQPAFFFHGWPSGREQGALMHDLCLELGVHLCAPDRPGIGLSDPQPGRRLLDWPPLLGELADHLGWDRFHLFGVSGGGPYVMVSANSLPERVLSASYICGAPPLKQLGTQEMFWPYRLVLFLRRLFPWALGPVFRLSTAISRLKPDQAPLSWLMATLGPRDREVLSDPVVFDVITRSLRECLASGVPNVQADGDLYLEDWGFDPAHIKLPVHIWHGLSDRNIPQSYAQRVAALMPHAITHWSAEDGHYSLPVRCLREILCAALDKPAAQPTLSAS